MQYLLPLQGKENMFRNLLSQVNNHIWMKLLRIVGFMKNVIKQVSVNY